MDVRKNLIQKPIFVDLSRTNFYPMNFLHIIILSIVEGLTEFLPISSTGHLIIASHVLGIPETEFLKSFQIIIQVGAIAAVGVVYFKKIFSDRELLKKVIIGFIPTAIIGYGLYSIIKQFLIGNLFVVAISLIIGGIIIIIFEYWYGKRNRQGKTLADMNYWEAFVVGCVQSLAVIPGVSRSGATIIGGLAQNISREAIVEFSFLLAVPVIAAAALLDIIKTPLSFTSNQWGMIAVGVIASFITALFAIRFFLNFIKTRTFAWFGYYRIIVGAIALIVMFVF